MKTGTGDVLTKSRLILLGKVAVFVAGAVLSNYLDVNRPAVAEYFIGAVFGTVILVWHVRSVRELASWRAAAFIGATILIFMVVRILPEHKLNELDSLSEIIAGLWSFILDGLKYVGGVLFSTVALPVAHALLLGASLKRLLVAIPVILGVWFKVSLLWLALLLTIPDFARPLQLIHLIDFTSIWQAAYLVCMFAFRPKRLRAQEMEIAGAESIP